MEVKIGNIEMKMPIDEFMGKFNPFETMFSKLNPSMFNDMLYDYQKVFGHQFQMFAKQMKKYSKQDKDDK